MRTAPFIAAITLLAPVLAAAKPETPPALVALGPPIDTIQVYNVESILPLGPRALLFKMRSKPDYRSDLDSDCRYDPDTDIVIHRTPTTSYTSGEILDLQDRYQHFIRGACIVGPFTPVKRAPAQP